MGTVEKRKEAVMTLGVIGGLGPMATAGFLELVTQMTDAGTDQEHLNMIIYSAPGIPDRTAYILGQSGESPVGPMIDIGRKLCEQGADFISIPCITAHYFHRELQESISVPIINAIYETGMEIQKNQIEKVGILATDGTIQSRIFQNQLEDMGMEVLVPGDTGQQYVMDIIYKNVKAGKAIEVEKFRQVSWELFSRGAQILVLGCTELSSVKKEMQLREGYLDAMEVLAQRSVLRCNGKLRKEYENLVY